MRVGGDASCAIIPHMKILHMKERKFLTLVCSTSVPLLVMALHAKTVSFHAEEIPDCRVRAFVSPVRVVWKSADRGGYGSRSSVEGVSRLLGKKRGQVYERVWGRPHGCTLVNNGVAPGFLLDFGREYHGGVQIGTTDAPHGTRIRVRFGESVGEAMSEIGEKGACNDHAPRDVVLETSHLGQIEYGHTGFRFVRIDLVTPGSVTVEYVRAVSLMRPMKRIGSFVSSDDRLNQIWETAVRTVHLCCQDYLWDGIKRDRVVWMGDMHPETRVILSVFGEVDVLKRSFDHVAETTPPGQWMNGIDTYTTWYMRNVHDWYRFTGDVSYIRERAGYLRQTIEHLLSCDGRDERTEMCGFLDWPTRHNPAAETAGSHALRAIGFDESAIVAEAIGDNALAARCRAAASRLRSVRLESHGSKSAAAFLVLGGFRDAREMFAETIGRNGHSGVSTFFGYYMLEAMSAAGEDQRALDTVRDYWGGMLDMGATSFWENFDVSWTNNAVRIDQMPVSGKKDIHGDFGEFCYPGFRHSLCHGWSGGPAAWCINHVLGVRPLDVGCRTVEVKPFLGDLEWAEGSMALPGGRMIRVRVDKLPDGSLKTSVHAPDDVKIVQ